MEQSKLKDAVMVSKFISEHLDKIYESQDSLYLKWLDSLPKLKQEDSSDTTSDKPKYIWTC